uniref:Calcineurin-binding protein cabin-1 MEF2-binding domain-containing protein n=1 Tax=Periophthalmus magnuspinnatus TaxID=409849 RepID=A0A3B4BJR7_9GOBI
MFRVFFYLQGIWRIPVDEIDRPGSFASHMNRSIVLLLEVLYQLKDHDTLLKVSFMLQRTPDQGKKFLRDVDRQVLAKRAFFLTVKVLEDNLNTSVFSQVSEQLPKAAAPSMGEMTTTESSNKASSEDSKHGLPKKAGLTEGVCTPAPDGGPREASQASDTRSKTDGDPGKVEGVGNEIQRRAPEEPMDLDSGLWRRTSTATDSQGNKTEADISLSTATPQQKGNDNRAPELSLEELSISSRQQQVQASALKATTAPDQMGSHRPNRKRKLIEDVESGKTLLLNAYRVWQQGQKVMTYDLGSIEKIMSETYMLMKQVDEDVALDQAVKFCQIQMATSTQRQVMTLLQTLHFFSDPSKLPDPSRIRSRVPPNMPKLFIPSTVAKFPPEITVTPPTPTLLSPKGSISEETKLKLKNVILASQSAATVKKDTLTQPALEVQETSSQESSLESESDEEDDYMDI